MNTEHTISPTPVTSNSEQLAVLKQHFPHCFDKQGQFVLSRFQEVLQAHEVATTQESYKLDWLGKSYARLLANEPIRTLLSADVAHNSQAANLNSQNLLIKGDNLEVLKHLKGAYREAVKMIYIDPPYNTGSDGFVYQDDRKFTPEQLADLANVTLEEAKRILDFTQRGANSHSAWLTFMYPRLYVAKQLLRDDGVIFISIDDNEQAQLKLLCDEVFGEGNFVALFPWKKRTAKSDVPFGISQDFEWVYCYAKSNTLMGIAHERKYYQTEDYPNDGWRLSDLTKQTSADERPNSAFDMVDPKTGKNYPFNPKRTWIVSIDTFQDYYNRGKIVFPDDYEFLNISTPAYRVFESEDKAKAYKKFGSEDAIKSVSTFFPKEIGMSENGNDDIVNLFGQKIFSYPKPVTLIKYLLNIINNNDCLVLDFFAGSGTTAHAVMQLNAEDGGNRQFICVQLDEKTDPKKEAYKAGYKSIFDITQARIQKAAQKIQTDNPNYTGDLGFKLFKTVPIFEHYQQPIAQFDPNQELFDGTQLSQQDLANLLTTWQVQHNIPLSQTLNTIDLGGYTAHWFNDTLYLMAQGFDSPHLKAFIQKLDTDNSFTITKLIMFGYNINSKMQREIDEGLKNYRNKKSITLDVVVKY